MLQGLLVGGSQAMGWADFCWVVSEFLFGGSGEGLS